MKRSRRALYLSFFALFSTSCTVSAATTVSSNSSPDVCALEPKAKVSDACASYADLDTLNDRLHPYVRNLASNTDFFSYYRLNLYNKKCPFWSDEDGLCGNIACAVTTLENEEDIPAIWRAEELSRLEGPKAHHPGKKQQQEEQRPLLGELGEGVGESCVVEYDDECDDRDYCVPEDEGDSAKGDYVSLVDNPERFTGYAGEGAHQVWEAIYWENCFSKQTRESSSKKSSEASLSPFGGRNQAQAAQDFKQVMKAHDRQNALDSGSHMDSLDAEEECLEKRVFYRVISGMHASISTHLCYDYLNQSTGEWGPNLQCYKERLHSHPERISNLYFNYALMLRAVGKLRAYVQDYTYCTGDARQDHKTKTMLFTLADTIPEGPKIFDESVMFQDQTLTGIELKEDFRNRFRNVSRIMDCVGCDKCRLWGKLQTNGFGTALKVLFEFGGEEEKEEEQPLLRRTELVALVNTLDKISSALKALEHFREMIRVEHEQELDEAEEQVSTVKAPPTDKKPLSPPSSPQQIKTSYNNLDDLDDLDEDAFSSPASSQQRQTRSFSDDFYAEINLIYRTWIFVLKSWASLPRTLGSIALVEFSRLYAFWLGRPVPPRMWEFHFPTPEDLWRDEL